MITPCVDEVIEAVRREIDAHPDRYRESPEPYRAAMYAIGYGDLDGTPLWDEIMDAIG